MLRVTIGGKIRQEHILVRRTVAIVEQPLIQLLKTDAAKTIADLIHHTAQHLVTLIEQRRIIPSALHIRHLVGMQAEEEHVFIAQHIVHLHIGAIQSPDGQCSIHHEFHISGAGGLLAGGGNLLRHLRCRHQLFRQRHAVILQKHHLQLAAAQRIAVDLPGQHIDQADNIFRHLVARRRLGAEQIDMGDNIPVRIVVQLLIAGNDLHHIEQLALIFMQALNLDVENTVHI